MHLKVALLIFLILPFSLLASWNVEIGGFYINEDVESNQTGLPSHLTFAANYLISLEGSYTFYEKNSIFLNVEYFPSKIEAANVTLDIDIREKPYVDWAFGINRIFNLGFLLSLNGGQEQKKLYSINDQTLSLDLVRPYFGQLELGFAAKNKLGTLNIIYGYQYFLATQVNDNKWQGNSHNFRVEFNLGRKKDFTQNFLAGQSYVYYNNYLHESPLTLHLSFKSTLLQSAYENLYNELLLGLSYRLELFE